MIETADLSAELTALRESEQQFRSFFEQAVEGMFQTTPDGSYLRANPALARIYGYDSPDDLIHNITDIAHQLYVNPTRRAVFTQLLAANDVVSDFESQIYRRDGSIRWIVEQARAVRDRHGHLRYYQGTVQDITARKQAEENLRASEARYRSLVEASPDAILLMSLDDTIMLCNEQAIQLLGLSHTQDVVGRTLRSLLAPEDQPAARRQAQQVLVQRPVPPHTYTLLRPDGRSVAIEVSMACIYDTLGRPTARIDILRDISACRTAEQWSQAQSELLDHLNQDLYLLRNHAQGIAQALAGQPLAPVVASLAASLGDVLLRIAGRHDVPTAS